MNLPAFSAQLKTLKENIQKKAVRSATGAASAVISRIAKQNVLNLPNYRGGKNPGRLKRSVYWGRSRKQVPGAYRNVVSVRAGKKQQKAGRDAYYWRWVEAGHHATGRSKIRGGSRTRALTRQRLLKQGGSFVQGRWFLRNALRSGQSQAVAAFSQRMSEQLKKYERGI